MTDLMSDNKAVSILKNLKNRDRLGDNHDYTESQKTYRVIHERGTSEFLFAATNNTNGSNYILNQMCYFF
jgi:hypothetical protein